MADAWWEEIDESLLCDGLGWVDDWLTAVRDTIVECLEACGLPPVETACVSLCAPDVTSTNAGKCCQRLDVWRGSSSVVFRDSACRIAAPTLDINWRLLRCAVSPKCSPEERAAADRAISYDQAMMLGKVPAKLTTCCGGLVTSRVTATPICDPCVGVSGSFTVSGTP